MHLSATFISVGRLQTADQPQLFYSLPPSQYPTRKLLSDTLPPAEPWLMLCRKTG